MGPVLFATPIQELLTKLQNDHPCVVVLAYLDDVFLVGASDNVLAVFEDLKPMFHDTGLDIQDTKCEIYSPSSVEIKSLTSIPITKKEYLFWEFLLERKISCHRHVLLLQNMEKIYAINYLLYELRKLCYC